VAPPDPVCQLAITKLEHAHDDRAPATLTDVLASTALVAVVVPVLDAPDCSGVGWRHLAYEPFDPARSNGLVRAYQSMHLPTPAPIDAPYYLMGGTFEAARDVDLKKVCVSFKSQVNARAEWVVPLRDRADALAWEERLSRRVCGRPRPGCEDCSNECGGAPGCCRVVMDSCPGPAGRYSTCGGFTSCDVRCCE
jgi:hypothetical protein